MTIDPFEFRRILGHWVTGVAIVAVRDGDGQPRGFTANAFSSLSLEPPLVLVCVDRAGHSHDCIRDAGAFAVSVLGADAEALARRFAETDAADRFQGVDWTTSASGAPVLGDALAWVDCSVVHEYPGGDHTIFVGSVLAADAVDREPLVYFRGGYGRFGH